MIIVVDDERTFEHFPDEETIYFRSSGEAIDFLDTTTVAVEELWLDHDLGGEDTVMKLVDFLIEAAFLDNHLYNWTGKIYVHSMNPVGAANIVRALGRYYDVERVPLPACV